MKLKLKPSLLTRTALALLASAGYCYAQLPVSRQVINVPVALPGSGAATPVGIPVMQEPVARDIVSATTASTITGTTGGYAIYPANSHMVLIKTGPGYGKGLTITSNTASVLTVTGTIPALEPGSDEFEIVPLPTLATVFGGGASAPAPIDLSSGPSLGPTVDRIIIAGQTYFYRTGTSNGGPAWRLSSATTEAAPAKNNLPIANLLGVAVIRTGTDTTLNVRGVAREGRAIIPVPVGTTPLSWPFPQEVSLINSKLNTTLVGGPSAGANVDRVVINGQAYIYRTGTANGGPAWRLTTSLTEDAPARNNVILNPGGRAFVITRQAAGGATNHTAEESYTP
jgi:uncharacterized protein (TIGR02597 family)